MEAVKPPFRALLLYGSHARGDVHEGSDVDILQVTSTHTAPYAVGRVNVTCYTLDQLLRLARKGGLFARHIIEEALPLTDPSDIFGALQAAYVRPLDYHEAIAEIVGCGPLLDVTDSEFKNDADGLSSLVSYLVRSYLYAIAFERGANSFSMAHVLELLGQQRASAILSDVRSQRSALAFALARSFFEELTGTACQRTEGSLEAFLVNASVDNELAVVLGLRLLAKGRPFTYDALLELEF